MLFKPNFWSFYFTQFPTVPLPQIDFHFGKLAHRKLNYYRFHFSKDNHGLIIPYYLYYFILICNYYFKKIEKISVGCFFFCHLLFFLARDSAFLIFSRQQISPIFSSFWSFFYFTFVVILNITMSFHFSLMFHMYIYCVYIILASHYYYIGI